MSGYQVQWWRRVSRRRRAAWAANVISGAILAGACAMAAWVAAGGLG